MDAQDDAARAQRDRESADQARQEALDGFQPGRPFKVDARFRNNKVVEHGETFTNFDPSPEQTAATCQLVPWSSLWSPLPASRDWPYLADASRKGAAVGLGGRTCQWKFQGQPSGKRGSRVRSCTKPFLPTLCVDNDDPESRVATPSSLEAYFVNFHSRPIPEKHGTSVLQRRTGAEPSTSHVSPGSSRQRKDSHHRSGQRCSSLRRRTRGIGLAKFAPQLSGSWLVVTAKFLSSAKRGPVAGNEDDGDKEDEVRGETARPTGSCFDQLSSSPKEG